MKRILDEEVDASPLLKKLAIMQPYLFPYLGYYQMVRAVDKFIFLDDVNFIKKGHINRNSILETTFTVPLAKISQNKHIKDTMLHDSYNDWRRKFTNTLWHCYSKAPFYKKANHLIQEVLDKHKAGDSIADLSKTSIKDICKYAGIQTEFVDTSSIYPSDLKGSDRILDICKRESATHYINTVGGRKLYSAEEFKQQGIDLKFLQHVPMDYAEHKTSYLSIIDVLMYASREFLGHLLNSYKEEK